MLLLPVAFAADLAIRHVTVLTMVGDPIPDGTVVIDKGMIVSIGGPVPAGTPELDGAGGYLMPGLIDMHSHMGVYSWPGGGGSSDGNEMVEPFTPRVWAGDSFDPEDPALARARAGGITTIQVLPGSGNMIGGRSVILKLRDARTVDKMVFAGAPPGIKMACGENPKRVYQDEDEHTVRIMTRMGEMARLRARLTAALEYRAARARPNPPGRSEDDEVLLDVLDGKVRVNLHCYRSHDIADWYRVADEYHFKISTIHHALDTYKVRDLLAAHGTGIATWPDWWGFKLEAMDGIPEGPVLVNAAGVLVATHSDSANTIQRFNIEAAKLVRAGMSEPDALRTLTINPAKLLGVDKLVGSIEPGKQADLALFDRYPLDGYARVVKTWVDGSLVYDRQVEGTPDGLR